VDIANLMNWFISVIYSATTDPFQGLVARDRTRKDSRWFWINWDMDHSFMDFYAQGPNPWEIDNFDGVSAITRSKDPRAIIFDRLRLESPEFRVLFLSRLVSILNHELTTDFTADLIQRYEDIAIASGIEDRRFLSSLRMFAQHRPGAIRNQMNTYFSSGPGYQLTVTAPDSLGLEIDGHQHQGRYSGWYFNETPVQIKIGDRDEIEEITWIVNGRAMASGQQQLAINLDADTNVQIRLNLSTTKVPSRPY
jgi:hypothetical protein